MQSVRNTQVKINIGLNNNPFESDEIIQMLENMGIAWTFSEIKDGTYKGKPEPTLVFGGIHSTIQGGPEFDIIYKKIQTLADLTEQEAIPFKCGWMLEKNGLSFGKSHKGPRFKFNENYFIN